MALQVLTQYSKFGNVIRNIQNKLGNRALKSDLKSTVTANNFRCNENKHPETTSYTQALSSTHLAGENTLAGAGHVYPKFWVAKSIIAVGGVVEESVCRVWKIATLCFIVSGDKHALYNKKS